MSTPRDRIEARLGLAGPPLQRLRDAPPRIPDHTLIRRIGQGAYGEVWLAKNALSTWRAVKVVYRDNFKDERPYEREFAGIRRFEPLSRSNEGFVDVLQVGRNDAEGWFYYVMELADGVGGPPQNVEARPLGSESSSESYEPRTLARDLAQRGHLPLDECLELGLSLTLALGHLHRHGLIHRDIKPSNIIFVGGVPKLADIGLVTEVAGANTFVGTEGFVPPEGPTSPRADLYALGKVLYEAAMGKDRNEFPEPFTQIGTDQESVALMELNAVLLRACAPNLERRYASAEAMHADLALLHSGGSVVRRHQFDRQFQVAKRVGALALATTILIGGALYWQRERTQKMADLAAQKSALAVEKTQLANDLASLDADNRSRIVRLDIANGLRLLDEGDPAGALLWFADALPLVTNNPAQESIHRIRIQQTLDRTPRVLKVFPHEAGLTAAAFSPDEQRVATATKDRQVRVWGADGDLLWGPKSLGATIYSLRFSRDGRRLLASTSWEQGMFNGYVPKYSLVAMLDAASGQEWPSANESWSRSPTNLSCAHFSPDDRWVALAEKGGLIRVFATEDGRHVTELRGHTSDVKFISFTTDGGLLASASLDRTVRLWRLPSGEPLGSPLEHRWPVLRALLTEDGRHLISASIARPGSAGPGEEGESEVQAWDVQQGRPIGAPIAAGGWVATFLAPPSQHRFYVHNRAYSLLGPRGSPLFTIHANAIHSWDFNPDRTQLAIGSGDYVSRVFDAENGTSIGPALRHGREVVSASFSKDSSQLLAASSDGVARLWSLGRLATKSMQRELAEQMQPLPPEVFGSHDGLGHLPGQTPVHLDGGKLVLVGPGLEERHEFRNPYPGTTYELFSSAWAANFWLLRRRQPDSNAFLLWRPEEENTPYVILEHPGKAWRHAFTRDDRYLVTSCEDNKVRFWRTADGQLEREVSAPADLGGVLGGLSPDGRTAIWFRDSGVRFTFEFLDLHDGETVGEPWHTTPTIFDSSFSPDGRAVALLDSSGPVTILEPRSGRLISSSIAHSSNLSAVEWHPNSNRLLTSGHDDQALVWDVASGKQVLAPLRTPGGIIRMARWSPDGRFIITRSDNRTARVWDASTGEAVTPALQHPGDVAFARMTRPDRLMTASHPGLLRAWDLRESNLPTHVLAGYAQWLSGRRLTPGGSLVALGPEEWGALERLVRNYPL